MVEFAYNNAKYTSTGYTSFKLKCRYHSYVSYQENVNPHSRSKVVDKLTKELRNLMAVCKKNLQHAQELQKRAHDKGSKPKSQTPGEKVWLNSKYIKTKRNWKLKVKFFRLFQVLHPIGSQAYKLELPKQQRIHNIFYVSLLEQDITRKGRVDEKTAKQIEFKAGSNNTEYKGEGICNSAVYAKESEVGHLLAIYYLVSQKSYLKDECIQELASAV